MIENVQPATRSSGRVEEATRCEPLTAANLLELAWAIIANAGNSDWTRESAEWQEAAARWRDDYHALTGARVILVPRLESAERLFPIQDGAPVPWAEAEIAYVGYSRIYGTRQSLQRLAERGGFDEVELRAYTAVARAWFRDPNQSSRELAVVEEREIAAGRAKEPA